MSLIALALEKPCKDSPLSEVFGRSNFYMLLDTSNGKEEFLPNPFVNELGGAGIQSAHHLINNNIEAIIVKKIGDNPLRLLTSVNIKVYCCEQGNAIKAIQLYQTNNLQELKADEEILPGRRRKRYGKKF